ncbi:MAG: SUMF1/EgtB/PvdO family nonheme iron enzyme [Anaerolineales bacterium]|nr:SUMF1/EgtB/PvdO family nonheme iron enzyme [Anaerolineales bacterium]
MKKTLKIFSVVILISIIGFGVWNLDIVIRAYRNIQNGTLSVQRLRYDIASFNIGQKSAHTPIDKKISAKDGMTQLFVPEGEFLMGKEGEPDQDSPMHVVYLDAYWIDQTEVSNSMYETCVEAGACTLPFLSENPYYGNWIYRNHPIIYVNWFQANQYCTWADRRLPTEAEFEKAARGTEKYKYPWGNDAPNPRLANYAESLIGGTVSVYRYPLGASPYGALNMVGNVREWIADWYSDTYYQETTLINPTGPETGIERSMRSGAYDADANEIFTTSRYKHEPQSAGLSRGFRCAESGE